MVLSEPERLALACAAEGVTPSDSVALDRLEAYGLVSVYRTRTRDHGEVKSTRLTAAGASQSTPATRATVDRSTFAADALRAVLDSQPEEGPARQRWGAEREAFVAQVEREARRMLADAVRAYREVRTGD